MLGQASPFMLPLLLVAGLSLAASVYGLRRGSVRGAPSFAAVTLGAAWYGLCYALELASAGLEAKIFWTRLTYIGIVSVAAGLLGFAWAYTGHPAWSRRRMRLLLAVEPIIAQTLLWTNDRHHLFWTRVWLQPYYGSFTRLAVSNGPVFWVHMVYTYGILLVAMVILGRAFARSSALHRRQTRILFACAVLMGVGRILSVSPWNPFAPVDPTPFLAGVAAILGAWSLWRHRVFDILPVARHAVVEQIDEGMVVVNAQGYIVDINATALRLLGQQAMQVIGRAASEVLPFYDEFVRRHGGQGDVQEEIVWPAADGQREFELHRSALLDWQGMLAGHLFVLHDITERKQAEKQLRRSSRELSMLYETSLEVASRLDLTQLLPIIVERAAQLLHASGCGMYLYMPASDSLEYVVAYGAAEKLIGHTLRRGEGVCGRVLETGQPLVVDDYHHWAGRSPLFEQHEVGTVLGVPVKWGERVLGVIDVQRDVGAVFTPEDTRLLTLFATQAAIAVANAQLYETARRELAERKSAETQLQQAQRMEAVGILAGGVAHEFNNLLTVMEGNVELVMADLAADDPLRAPLATVSRTAQRAATLTRQLLAFSRRQVLERRAVDLNKLIVDFTDMLQHAVGPDVQLRFSLAPESKPVLADPGAIEQVLMNLALNARDAMPRGGELRLTTAPVLIDEEFRRTHGDIKTGEYVRLTVSDTGVGMDEVTLRHMFEPFFTTKEVGKGTGLGLSVVYGIIRQHEGLIEVHSQVGQGTQFDVYLPVYDKS